jgi:hypothetical protein
LIPGHSFLVTRLLPKFRLKEIFRNFGNPPGARQTLFGNLFCYHNSEIPVLASGTISTYFYDRAKSSRIFGNKKGTKKGLSVVLSAFSALFTDDASDESLSATR